MKGKGRLTTYFVITPYDSFENQDLTEIDSQNSCSLESAEQELEPPPSLDGLNDEVEELCVDKSSKISGQGSD